ncbi:MAG: hypothetical protein MZU84_04230 [Sphingobacterium sp.]|nr:hypothetical protein [Sphingobacterium sp.]
MRLSPILRPGRGASAALARRRRRRRRCWPFRPAAADRSSADMFVSVLDKADEPVLTLGAPDFVVREDGRVREVLRARQATDPIDIAARSSTPARRLGNQVNDVRKGLEAFIAKMRPQAQIVDHRPGRPPDHLRRLHERRQEQLARRASASSSRSRAPAPTSLDGGATRSLKGLEKRKPERSAVVVVWAGGPEFSTGLLPAAHRRAQGARHRAARRSPSGPGRRPTPGPREGRNRELLFDRGTTRHGRAAARTSSRRWPRRTPWNAWPTNCSASTASRSPGPTRSIPPEKTEVAVAAGGPQGAGHPGSRREAAAK